MNDEHDGEQPPESPETNDTPPETALFDDPLSDSVGNDVSFETVEFAFPALTKSKVAVVGFATGHVHKAPFGDEQVEKWGINQLWKIIPEDTAGKFDRWFELHSLYDFYHANPAHQDFLRNFAGPVYVREQDYALALEWGIDTAQPFPHRIILDQFRPYFNNTVSWLIALAILMRPEWLGIYGVDMAQDHLLQAEYSQQRPSCEYFIGVAEGLGIDVSLPGGSDLLKATHLYGYEDSGPVLEKMISRFEELGRNKEQIRAQIAQLDAQRTALEGTMSQMDGAMQEVTYWRKNWLTLPTKD